MPKKGDILLKCYNEFPEYYETYKTRLEELEREFLHAKNDKADYLQQVEEDFKEKEQKLINQFYEIELKHKQRIYDINQEFNERLTILDEDIISHNKETEVKLSSEDAIYQDILDQFEERKAEAFNTYLRLTKETNYQIDREMKVHKDFIKIEDEKLNAKKIEYQDLNSTLSNKLIWTMEKAKNALSKLSASLTEEGDANKEFLDDTINQSLAHLNDSREAMSALFKTTSIKFERERDIVKAISKDKRKPHSDLNQQMITTFIKQIRAVNENKTAFEVMIKRELELSLSRVYPKIIDADSHQNNTELRKYILQKEIIEKKAEFLLNRNKTMADLLIAKYQNEIKKIKIDSYKRFEEIKLAYQVPVAFFQNSVNVYSNFAFYFNETYEDLYRMLQNFKKYNAEYTKLRTDYIHNSQKSFEDYKINLLVKVNDITDRLTEYIQKIDHLSNEIVTLESNNRLEIAEIRKRMENLEIFGDYQKYIASLENDQFFAMNQHNKNIEKVQIESNYKNNLLSINREVLNLNQNKLEYTEYKDYMIEVANHENEIQNLAHQKRLEEAKALYKQKMDQVKAMSNIAKHKIVHNAMVTNYGYASSYVEYLNDERKKNSLGSNNVIEFIHHAQKLIDLNSNQTKTVDKYIKTTEDNHAYLRTLEKDKLELLLQVDNTAEKKNYICKTAIEIYRNEIEEITSEFNIVIEKYLGLLRDQLLHDDIDLIKNNIEYNNAGFLNEISSAINYVHKKALSLAFKYQVPNVVSNLESALEKNLGDFVYRNMVTFKKVKKNKSPYKVKELLKGYYILTYDLLNKYEAFITKELNIILEHVTKNDRLFIENTNRKAERTKEIIIKEYEKLEFQALKSEKSRKKQAKHLKFESERISNLYKKQVKNLNQEYLQKVKESDEIAKIINKKFTKIVEKNLKDLNSMILFLEKNQVKEQKMLDKQYNSFLKTLDAIEVESTNNHLQEVTYIDSLYKTKDIDASKTINVLETKITSLPIEKENHYLSIKKERNQLEKVKSRELRRKFAELEKDKFVSRPKYLEEIENVKKRLPDDYIRLYAEIQNLEFDYLNQFANINQEYEDNYREYILNQSGNNEAIEPNSHLYSPFNEMQSFFNKSLEDTNQTHKETINKSKKTRNDLNKEESKSKENQNRIINV